MYGLAGQTESSWMKTLEAGCELFSPSTSRAISSPFTKNTPFWELQAKGEITPLDEEKESSLFVLTSAFLEEKGYIHYEVSNFASGQENLCKHKPELLETCSYLGLGPSAHFCQDGGSMVERSATMERYCHAPGTGQNACGGV